MMRKIITLIAFAIASLGVQAQQQARTEVSHSKWEDKKNGQSYIMEAVATSHPGNASSKASITFSIVGQKEHLSKVSLKDPEQYITFLALNDEPQQMLVHEGVYIFKFYHTKMGEKVFEVEVKKGDAKEVALKLK